MWRNLRNRLNTTFTFPREERVMLYRVLEAQLRAGIPAHGAVETLARRIRITPAMVTVCQAATGAAAEGRGVVAGFADSGCFPADELGLLAVAEDNGTLTDALGTLQADAERRLGFAARVLAPNLYYLVILAVVLVLATLAKGFMAGLADVVGPEALVYNDAYRVSLWLNAWGPWALGLLVCLGLLIAWCRAHATGPARKALLFFDQESRLGYGIRYCELAASLYAQGANHNAVFAAARQVLGSSRMMRRAIGETGQAHREAGLDIEDALAGRLLAPRYAGLLAGMAPGGQRDLYPRAFRALASIQRAVLAKHYRRAFLAVRLAALCLIFYLFTTLAGGLYTFATPAG